MAKAGTNTTQSLNPVWGKKTIKVMVNYPAEKKKKSAQHKPSKSILIYNRAKHGCRITQITSQDHFEH